MYYILEKGKKSDSRLCNSPGKNNAAPTARKRRIIILLQGVRDIVKVKFLGHLRTRFGLSEVEIPISSEESLMVFLDKLSNLYPELRAVIENIRESSGEYLLLINGIDVNVYGDISKVEIKNNDEIIFLPTVHGGVR